VAEAYASFLPQVSVSSDLSYQLAGTPRIGGLSGEDLGLSRTPAQYFSSYGINVGMTISGATFFDVARTRAQAKAAAARTTVAGFDLDATITRQYVAALRARDVVTLRQQELSAASEAYKLADARVAAGSAPRLDVTQAEVARGRAEVALLQAENEARAQRLALLRAVGVELDREVELTTALVVSEPSFQLESLLQWAMRSHPATVAARASESASVASARAAKTQYLPRISVGGGWSGFTRRLGDEKYVLQQARDRASARVENCEFENELNARLSSPLPGYTVQDCGKFAFTDALGREALAANDVFPFNFSEQPPSFGISVSLPLFDGLTRERQLQQARAEADDAKYLRREEELNRRSLVINAYHDLMTAYRSVGLEERNSAAGAEQLALSTERYRLNAGSILELQQAQAVRAQAEQARLAALYGYHESLAALEAAVGRPLR
jgi:outer membrane protein